MSTTRQQKFSKLIQKEMGEILRLTGIELYGRGFLVSVTDVTSSPDLSYIKVYLSIFPPENRKIFFDQLSEHTKEIRRQLGENQYGQRITHEPIYGPDGKMYFPFSMDTYNRLIQNKIPLDKYVIIN